MTDITPASLAEARPSSARSSRPRTVADHGAEPRVTRAEIHAFGAIAALIAVIVGATLTFGLAGLIVVYLALVPICMVALVLITVGR